MDAEIRAFLESPRSVIQGIQQLGDGQLITVWRYDLPDCHAQGDSLDVALERLDAMLPSYLEAVKRLGQPIPVPALAPVEVMHVEFYRPVMALPVSDPNAKPSVVPDSLSDSILNPAA